MDKLTCNFCNKQFGAREEYTLVTVSLPSGVELKFNACNVCAYNSPAILNGKLEDAQVQS